MALNKPPFNELMKTMNGLLEVVSQFSECVGVDWEEISWSADDLMEVCVRVHKASNYYELYHDEDLQEPYETAILVYWILKLRLFKLDESFSTANTKIAALLLYSVAAWRRGESIGFSKSGEFWKNLCYALHYRDLSHEAIMHLAEALVA